MSTEISNIMLVVVFSLLFFFFDHLSKYFLLKTESPDFVRYFFCFWL